MSRTILTSSLSAALLLSVAPAAAQPAEPQPKPGDSNYWTIERYLKERPVVREIQWIAKIGPRISARVWGRTDQKAFVYSKFGPRNLADLHGTNAIALVEETTVFCPDGKSAFQLVWRQWSDDRQAAPVLAREELRPNNARLLLSTIADAPIFQAGCTLRADATVLYWRVGQPFPQVEVEFNSDGTWAVVHCFGQRRDDLDTRREWRTTYDYTTTVYGGLPAICREEEFQAGTRCARSECEIEKLVLGEPLRPADLDWTKWLPDGIRSESVPLVRSRPEYRGVIISNQVKYVKNVSGMKREATFARETFWLVVCVGISVVVVSFVVLRLVLERIDKNKKQ